MTGKQVDLELQVHRTTTVAVIKKRIISTYMRCVQVDDLGHASNRKQQRIDYVFRLLFKSSALHTCLHYILLHYILVSKNVQCSSYADEIFKAICRYIYST